MKDTVKRIKRQATDWKKIFTQDLFHKGLLFEIYREHLKLNCNRRNNPIKKWAKI